MSQIPAEMVLLIAPFAQVFSERVRVHGQILRVGAILSPNPGTVTAALRVMGRHGEKNWSKYYRVLRRVRWSASPGTRGGGFQTRAPTPRPPRPRR